MRRARAGVLLAGCAAALTAAGCGDNSSYKNDPRPPAPIVVTAVIAPDHVSVSPRRFGAGPISLVVTNQTGAAQRITLERSKVGTRPFSQQTSPISPSGTASLKADVTPGTYAVHVERDGIRPAKVTVGRERPSAQNDLLQP